MQMTPMKCLIEEKGTLSMKAVHRASVSSQSSDSRSIIGTIDHMIRGIKLFIMF